MKKRSLFTYWRDLSALAIFLPAILISTVLVYQIVELDRTSVKKQTNAQAEIHANKLASTVQTMIIDWQYTMAKISNGSVPSKSTLASEFTIQFLNRHPAIKAMQVFSVNGQLIETVPQQVESIVASTHIKKFIKQLTQPSTAPFYTSYLSTQYHQLLIASKLNLQQTTHIVVIAMDVQQLIATQIDSSQQINIQVSAQEILPAESEAAWLQASADINLGKQSYKLIYTSAPDDVSTPIFRATISVLLLSVAVLVPSLLVTSYYSRKLFKPLKSISYLVQQYADGNFKADIEETRFTELERLKMLLQDMARKVSQSKAELESRVQQRTNELELANTELLQVLNSIEEMQEQAIASEKMSSLGRLVAGIAHEINTPVGIAVTASTSLQSFVNNLKQKSKENKLTRSDLNRYIESTLASSEILVTNLNRAAELVHNFKEVAVDQSSEGLRKFNLQSYMHDVLSTVKPRFGEYKIEVIEDIDPDIVLYSYPGAVAQVITNLYENSVLHGFQQYQSHMIKISAHNLDSCTVELRFEDDGCGMTDEVKEHIFDPFFTTSRGQGASGLGMHIVYNLITQKLGGQIEIGSPSIGVDFKIKITRNLA